MKSDSSNISPFNKIWVAFYGLLVALVVAVLVPVGAFLVALAFTLFNQITGWFKLGETQAWLGVVFALYALYADIIIAPFVWWRVFASRLGLSRKADNIGSSTVLACFSLICLGVIGSEQAITNAAHLEDISDDGKYVLAASTLSDSSKLFIVDTSTGASRRLTKTRQGYENQASFSPDGHYVVFAYSEEGKTYSIILSDIGGSNLHPSLTEHGNDWWPRFSRDGRTIYFVRITGNYRPDGFDLYSTSLDGKDVTQLTHQHFSFDGEPYLQAAPALSSDGKQLLFTTDESLQLCSISNGNQQPSNFLFPLTNAPSSRHYVSSYFSADDRGIVFMAASEGKNGYRYDAYRVDLLSRRVQKLTENNGYASDFRLSAGGNKAVFLKWKFSRFQKLPRSFQMQLLDMQSGSITPVNFRGLPPV